MRASATKKKVIGSGSSALTPSTSKRIRGTVSSSTPVARVASPTSKNSTAVVAESDDVGLPLGTSRCSETFVVGERVFLHGLKKWGFVRYFGSTWFSDGKWVGIELMEESGRNDGTVQGRKYFTCKPKYGVFVRPNNCSKSGDAPPSLRNPIRADSSTPDRTSLPSAAAAPNSSLPPRIRSTSATSNTSQLSSIEDKIAGLTLEVAKISVLESEHSVMFSRIQSLESSLGAIAEKAEQAHDLISSSVLLSSLAGRDVAAPKHSESSAQDDTEKSRTPPADEVEALKSTLAMVAALARQAQDATLQERMETTEKIRALEAKLSTSEKGQM